MRTAAAHRSTALQLGAREVGGQIAGLVSGANPTTAPLWRRVLARLLDMACVFFLLWFLVVMHVLWFMRDASRRVDPAPWGRAFVPLCCFIVLSGVYEVVFLRWNAGQTPGKQFFGVQVVRAGDGSALSARRALARWTLPGLAILVWPPWVGIAVLALTAVVLPFGPDRRAIHDRLAGTRVMRYEPVEDTLADADDPPDESEPSGLASPPTMVDLLFGRPTRRALRRRVPLEADQEVDRA